MALSVNSLASSSANPLLGLGGGNSCIFNLQHTNQHNFADFFLKGSPRKDDQPDLFNMQPGDEPIKFVEVQSKQDSIQSKEESIQKRFYLRGLHKKCGRYVQAVDHLVASNSDADNPGIEEDQDKTPIISNQTIDFSNVDLTYKLQVPTLNNKQEDSKMETTESVWIQHQFIHEGKNSADIIHEEDFDPSIDKEYYDVHSIKKNTQVLYKTFDPSVETIYVEDEIMGLINKKQFTDFDKLCFYDDPKAQMDNGAKCSVTNIVEILQNVRWYDDKFKAPVHMKGATLVNLIIPAAQGWLRIQANTKSGYLDVLCFYSPHFTSTLLADRDILHSWPYCKQFSGQVMSKYF